MNLLKKSLFLALSISCLSSLHAGTEDSLKNIKKPTAMRLVPLKLMSMAYNNPGKTAIISFLAWSIVIFQTTEPNDMPVRYSLSLDEFLKQKSTWDKLCWIARNGKYLILDGFIGHKGKTRSLRTYPSGKVDAQLCKTLKIDPETQKAVVVLRPGAPEKGLYGWIHNYGKPIPEAIALLLWMFTATEKIEEGFEYLSEYNFE